MTELEHTQPCDYCLEVDRISELLTDFDPNHSFSAVSDHVEALLKRFGAIAATPDAPSDLTAAESPRWVSDLAGCSEHGLEGDDASCEACYPSTSDPTANTPTPDTQ